jgi:cytochrome c
MIRFAIVAVVFMVAACGRQTDARPDGSATPPAPAVAATGPSPKEIAAALAGLPAPYNAADYENGRRLFAQCRSCHTLEAGGANRVGPNLHAMFGRAAGVAEGFRNYSAGLKGSGIVWDEASLDAWIENPRDVVAQSTMIYPGLRRPEDRRDVIAFLKIETSK